MSVLLSNVKNDLVADLLNFLDERSNPKDVDEAIEQLTTENYSSLYGTYNEAVNSKESLPDFDNKKDLIPDATIVKEPNLHQAWDPRLQRVDGFVLTTGKGGGGHPTIVPFASTTAAGAFYDMVFTIERSVDLYATDHGGYGSNTGAEPNTKPPGDNNDNNKKQPGSQTGPDINGSEKIWKATQNVENAVVNNGDYYGVASIVNPYTLTKLCGGLVKNGQSKKSGDNIKVENHMYDVRDSRRFYGNVINSGVEDVLSVTNPTTTNIITYSNNDKWGRTPYYFLDFVFCKYWNIIPNNHLITLRKYHAPVYDNLLFSSMFDPVGDSDTDVLPFAPIATVVTYFGEDTGNTLLSLFSFTTGTKWLDIKSEVHSVDGNNGSDPHAVIDDMFSNGGGFPTGESNAFKQLIGSANFITGKMFSFGKFVGLLSPDGYNINKDQKYFNQITLANVDPSEQLYSNKIIGPVNRINSTKARDAGVVFDLKLSITCQYVARPIGGVNTKAAMLDILSNCMEIASVDAVFWGGGYRFNVSPLVYPFKNTAFKNRVMDDLYAGRIFGKDGALAHTVEGVKKFGSTDKNGNNTGSFDWSNVVGLLGEVLGETLGALGEMLNSVSNAIFGGASSLGDWLNSAGDSVSEGSSDRGKKKLNSIGKNLNQMWRSQVVQHSVMPRINGMKALLTGEPVGNWHLTVGNPLNPIMVIGNLICTDMKVEAGEELGPDDFPLELKVTYTLEHAMARDKSGIQSMFNRGMGRIYQLPDWIRASSDYESKVDKFTGPSNNENGFFTPRYMNAETMAGLGGGTGFQTYKLPKPKELPTNAHTDNTVIAKFTPPDIDAAISNIKEGSQSFFGANANSRAWIRGIAATRKLMN